MSHFRSVRRHFRNDSITDITVTMLHRLPVPDPFYVHSYVHRVKDGVPSKIFQSIMDVHEDREKNLATATFKFPGFPGISKDDIDITFQNGTLFVYTETKKSERNGDEPIYDEKNLHVLQIPRGVQDEEIKATMANGILTVTFPRTFPGHPAKKIVISDS